jgi:hypothetical protein
LAVSRLVIGVAETIVKERKENSIANSCILKL